MKHQQQKQIKKTNDLIAISTIIGLVKNDEFPKAIDVAINRGFTAEQFGQMANMVDLSAEEIYENVIAY